MMDSYLILMQKETYMHIFPIFFLSLIPMLVGFISCVWWQFVHFCYFVTLHCIPQSIIINHNVFVMRKYHINPNWGTFFVYCPRPLGHMCMHGCWVCPLRRDSVSKAHMPLNPEDEVGVFQSGFRFTTCRVGRFLLLQILATCPLSLLNFSSSGGCLVMSHCSFN